MQHRPKRSLGQNFLRDAAIANRIVDALDLSPDDHIIEIGPGQGALTEKLIERGAIVTAIEFDRHLAPALQQRFASTGMLSVVEADALDVDFASVTRHSSFITHHSAKLVANLPYNISTPILQRLIDQREGFSRIVLMFQKEVVDRITAAPRKKERGFLSVVAQAAFEIEYLFDVPPRAFYPVPKVVSSVIRLTPKRRAADEAKLREVVSRAFMQKRKTLANNLSGYYPEIATIIRSSGLSEKARAEQLSLDDWRRLLDHV
jgi:16S rRNA (adenine1518-N6/adenine1519-N6)-dimethyltransferase